MSLFIPSIPSIMVSDDFNYMTQVLGRRLVEAPKVDTGHWQALTDVPQTQTRELRGVTMVYPIPDNIHALKTELMPSDPWAEAQFQERVAGEPVNPGETYTLWPWFKGNVPTHQDEATKFSHTYMERYWPRKAGLDPLWHEYATGLEGIRYRYGDLLDVIKLLHQHPHTRQAYLPVWFPEDTGAHADQRVPCSLGYHFMLRDGRLHCLYTIRSCDFIRHFVDDVYLTARLVQWVIERLQDLEVEANPAAQAEHGGLWTGGDAHGDPVVPGDLQMVMHSLHVFEGDMPKMRREYGFVAAS